MLLEEAHHGAYQVPREVNSGEEEDCADVHLVGEQRAERREHASLLASLLGLLGLPFCRLVKAALQLPCDEGHDEQRGEYQAAAEYVECSALDAAAGSLEEAEIFVRLGFKLGFGSILTNPAAKRAARVFAALHSGSWVIETDAPFMVPCTKKMNPAAKSEPLDLIETLKAAAALRSITIEAAAEESSQAALEVFPMLKTEISSQKNID